MFHHGTGSLNVQSGGDCVVKLGFGARDIQGGGHHGAGLDKAFRSGLKVRIAVRQIILEMIEEGVAENRPPLSRQGRVCWRRDAERGPALPARGHDEFGRVIGGCKVIG